MQFRDGARVYTADGREVGSVDRVVIDPRTDKITHIVVRKGWLFTEDKVIPTDLVETAVEDQVQLRGDIEDLDELPNFEETYYIPPEEMPEGSARDAGYAAGYAPALYWYPPVGAAWPGYYTGYYGYPLTPYVTHTERNVPEGTVALKEGAEVISADGERVGTVEEVLTNRDLNRATHLVISEGWLFKEKRVIPVDWIRDMSEDNIHLAVKASVLARVPAYQP
ncbi:MAG TPA: PRC-barrel domain-containing protein [Caldilineaceae bacterium]|nr:PRC-barrel domain-containing protein [Caldilineaceae bacterium]